MRNERQVLHAILVTATNARLRLLYVGAQREAGSIWGTRVAVASELTAADVAQALHGHEAVVAGGTVREELEDRGFVCHEIEVELADEYAISCVIHYDATTGKVRPWRLFSPIVAGPDTTAMLSLAEDGILPVRQGRSEAAELFYRAFPNRRRHNPQSVEFELQLEGWTDEQIIDTGL